MMALIYTDINQAVIRNVPERSLVLDIGCGTGALGEKLKQKECIVHGVEYSEESAKIANSRIDKVIVLNIEKEIPRLKSEYDVIIFADVLEHLRNPEEVLKKYSQFLKENGLVIISLPNIANWSIRTKLLFGKFNYTKTGILDETHLHFYTIKTAKKMVENVGLQVQKIDLTPNFVRFFLEPIKKISSLFGVKGEDYEVHEQLFNSSAFKIYEKMILPFETATAKLCKNIFAYQIVLIAKKKST